MPPKAVTIEPDRQWLLTAITALFLAAVLVHVITPILPELHWDVDPRSDRADMPITTLGPAGAAWLAVLGVMLAAASMAAHLRAGGRIAWRSSILAILGVLVCFHHMGRHFECVHRGGIWIGAVGYALAAAHLAQHDRPRRYIIAAMAAIVIPLTLRTAIYVWIEHAETVQMFLKTEKQMLEARGWDYGSPQHILYRRRLMFPDATGAFGLSNVFASIMAALTTMAAALTAGLAWRRKWKWATAPAVLVASGVFTVYLTHSKGGAGALAGGFVLVLTATPLLRGRRAARWLLPVAAMLMVLAAIAAVLLRPMLLGAPTSPDSELSLMFRNQYWQGAVAVMRHLPLKDKLLGVGPGMFKPHYIMHKNPLNPEEITSTHNVLLDYAAMLGVGGLAWSLMLLGWLWRGGRAAGEQLALARPGGTDDGDPQPVERADTLIALAVAGMAMVFQMAVMWPAMLTPESFFGWCMSIIAVMALTAALASRNWMDTASMSLALLGAAAVLMMHNQIEMTFYHDGAGVAALALLGAAGTGGIGEKIGKAGEKQRWSWGWPIGFAVLAIAMVFVYAAPMTRYQDELAQAARVLRQGDPMSAQARLQRAAGIFPADPVILRWRATLKMEEAMYHAGQHRPDLARQRTDEAVQWLEHDRRPYDVGAMRFEAQIQHRMGEMLGESARIDRAVTLWKQVLAENPYGLQDHLALADLFWSMGRHDEAKTLYQRCIMLSDDAFLDPAKQLESKDRQRVDDRLSRSSR
ncbi:MAG: O-antigen ligase family protein [Phycisphaeraceae bacterium]|nr:O-antigen ligase family protein [Phycisphaeraceae bacterium]